MIVFLTGAAGLLGGAIADRLTRDGHGVIALVHRSGEIKGNGGDHVVSEAFDGSMPAAGEVKTIKGNITLPSLGLDDSVLEALRSSVDCVVHCAALVRFEADYNELQAANIDGTRNVALAFADAKFIHVSTAYTCGLKDGPVPEAIHGRGGPFSNGYERSKAHAEVALLQLRPDAIIARPSIVVGEHASGRIRSFDTIYRAFKFIAEGHITEVPGQQAASLNFVPIDHVVEGISALLVKPVQYPAILHLASREAVPVSRFFKVLGRVPGLATPQMVSPDRGVAVTSALVEQAIQTYLPYFSRSPEFATDAFERLTGKPSPDMDDAALRRQIDYCVREGFIAKRGAMVSEAVH